MRLETERLRLRWWQESEAHIQRQLWTERDPRVPAHRRIDADGRPTLADLTRWIRTAERAYGFGLPAVEVVTTGQVIGYCGLVVNAKVPEGEPELAYELLTASWGNGYATEAARAVVAWAHASGHHRIWATVREWNTASRRVLAKLGFTETGQVDPDPIHGDSLYTGKVSS